MFYRIDFIRLFPDGYSFHNIYIKKNNENQYVIDGLYIKTHSINNQGCEMVLNCFAEYKTNKISDIQPIFVEWKKVKFEFNPKEFKNFN